MDSRSASRRSIELEYPQASSTWSPRSCDSVLNQHFPRIPRRRRSTSTSPISARSFSTYSTGSSRSKQRTSDSLRIESKIRQVRSFAHLQDLTCHQTLPKRLGRVSRPYRWGPSVSLRRLLRCLPKRLLRRPLRRGKEQGNRQDQLHQMPFTLLVCAFRTGTNLVNPAHLHRLRPSHPSSCDISSSTSQVHPRLLHCRILLLRPHPNHHLLIPTDSAGIASATRAQSPAFPSIQTSRTVLPSDLSPRKALERNSNHCRRLQRPHHRPSRLSTSLPPFSLPTRPQVRQSQKPSSRCHLRQELVSP